MNRRTSSSKSSTPRTFAQRRRDTGWAADLINTVVKTTTTPSFLFCLAITAAVVGGHVVDPESSALVTFIDKYLTHASFSIIREKLEKIIGLLIFLPPMVTAPMVSKFEFIAAVVVTVMALPAQPPLLYATLAFCSQLLLHATQRSTRFAIMSAVLVGLVVYYMSDAPNVPPLRNDLPRTVPRAAQQQQQTPQQHGRAVA